MKPLILTLLLSSLAACTQTREFTITPIKEMPKTASKKPHKSYTAKLAMTSGKPGDTTVPKRVANRIEVYDIGTTLDVEGNLIGPHKLYRVVETSKWVFAPFEHRDTSGDEKAPTPLKPKKVVPYENRQVSTAPVQPEPASVKTEPPGIQNAVAEDPANQLVTPQDVIRKQVTEGLNGEPSPSPAGMNALDAFSNSNP